MNRLPHTPSDASHDARAHFLQSIQQIGNNAVLLQRHEDGEVEALFASEDFASMMECSTDEALDRMSGARFYESTSPDDQPLVRNMLKYRAADDGSSVLTIQKVTAKLNTIWCNVHYAFIDDFEGHYVYCTYTDVTALMQYEERMRNVYSAFGENYYQVTEKTLSTCRVNLTKDRIEEIRRKGYAKADSVEHSYSDAHCKWAKYFPIESERKQYLDLFSKDSLVQRYKNGRAMTSAMFYTVRSNGLSCFVEFAAAVTRHPFTNDIVAFITERECNDKKVESTLNGKILAQQFDMVAYLANGEYGVAIGDAASVKQGSIFPTSSVGNYESYLRAQVEPVLIGSAEERDRVIESLSLAAIERHLKIAEPYVVDIAIEMDGETYYKQFDFYSIDPEARFYVLLKSDTTDVQKNQIAMNEQLREALEAAKQANVAKTAFLSSMSHEIRTPMNAIIGLDAIALKEPDLPEQTREHLEKIGNSAKHLLNLINDVLDMSRIESGRMTIRSEEFSFANMIEQINTMINSQCQDRGLSYECQVLGHVDERYVGDDMKLKQVLINILGNAVKFTPEGGTVSFTTERTAMFDNQSTLRFVIKDTGIGMDEDYLPKIFDAFSQEDINKANKYGSTGLGMAITKNIVEMMNGNISVESEKGVGTTFTVNVTLRNSSRTDQNMADVDLQSMHVLVIDDSPVDCEHAKIVLEEIGIAADTCQSGREAIEAIRLKAARHEAYNLILVDWKMPDQDGVDVTREIRKTIGNSSAVVVLTAYNWDEIADEATGAGVDSFMPKPLFASSVLAAFQQVMENRQLETSESEMALADLEGRKVLLAEDMPINAEIMIELLDMEGVQATHAENGKLAIEAFEQSEPGEFDAILMDIRMPVLDGLEAAAAIRALDRPDAKSVPIIAMTANAFDEDVQRSLQAGMNAHLSKPVDPERLARTLGELIKD